MAKVTTTFEIDFADYFDEFGFGDGDGPDAGLAERLLPTMIEEISKRITLMTDFTVEEGGDGSIHNTSIIQICYNMVELGFARGDDGQLQSCMDAAFEDDPDALEAFDLLLEVLNEVEQIFEAEVAQLQQEMPHA